MLDKGIFYRKIWAQGPGTSEKDVFLAEISNNDLPLGRKSPCLPL